VFQDSLCMDSRLHGNAGVRRKSSPPPSAHRSVLPSARIHPLHSIRFSLAIYRSIALRLETRTIMAIAGPLIAAYLAEFAMTLTTKIIIGQLGYKELASIGLASDMMIEVVIVIAGLLSVVGVLVAQADGADRKADAGIAARQGLIIATLLGIPGSALIWNLDSVLAYTGQDPDILVLMIPYLKPVALSLTPLLWFFVLRMFVASLAKTGAVMVISIVAVGIHYFLCLGLTMGKFGLPQMGLAGAGWAKASVVVFMFSALLIYTYRTPSFRGYGLFRGKLSFDFAVCKDILVLGTPVCGLVILESGLFAGVSILSGILGSVSLATYQVIITSVTLAFMFARGLAEASMIRIANAMGRGDLQAAHRVGLISMAIGVSLLLMLSVVPINFPEPLVRLFLKESDPGFEAVLLLTSRLIVLAACFQVFDGLQVIATMSLRGLKDTLVPLWVAAFGYWGFGIAGGWLLAFPLGFETDGLWWGMAAGLAVTGTLLTIRFFLLTRPENVSS
jgi:MATE family multidrug resistance protein